MHRNQALLAPAAGAPLLLLVLLASTSCATGREGRASRPAEAAAARPTEASTRLAPAAQAPVEASAPGPENARGPSKDSLRASALLADGARMAERGDLDLALRSYDLAEQFDPDVPRLAYNRGIALGRKGEHEAALLLFRRAVAEEPDYGPAHGNLAWVLMELDRQAEALEEIEEALVLNGANPVDLMNLSLIHI